MRHGKGKKTYIIETVLVSSRKGKTSPHWVEEREKGKAQKLIAQFSDLRSVTGQPEDRSAECLEGALSTDPQVSVGTGPSPRHLTCSWKREDG